MSSLPTYEALNRAISDLYAEVDGPTIAVATDYAKFLDGIGAPCPRVFWHGGDAIVFTWDTPSACWYLTLTEDGPAHILEKPPLHGRPTP